MGDCGSRPSEVASCLVGISEMALPSRKISPPVGLSRRDSERSKVDLPQPLGPTMEVTLPGAMSTLSPVMMSRSPYPREMSFAVS